MESDRSKGSADGISSCYAGESKGRRSCRKLRPVDADRGDLIAGVRGDGICFRSAVIKGGYSSRCDSTIGAGCSGDLVGSDSKGGVDSLVSGDVRESISRRCCSEFSTVDDDRGDGIAGVRDNGIRLGTLVIDKRGSIWRNRPVSASSGGDGVILRDKGRTDGMGGVDIAKGIGE